VSEANAAGSAAIDVALPYYGDVDLMKQAVRSVLGQQVQDWRLFVVDDGFPDPEPARWFADDVDDPRVTYQRNEHNLGANGNYRKCLDLATAPILVVMGADDVMQPNFLQVAADNFTAFGDAAIVQCGVAVIDEHGRLVRPLGDRIKERLAPNVDGPTLLAGEDLAVSLLRANWTYFPSLAWRTESMRRIGFREGLHVTQDLALILDTIRNGGGLVVDPTLAFLYRRHSQSDSSVKALDGRRFDEERALFAAEARDFAGRGWDRAARAARRHLTSRTNALTLLPMAVTARDVSALRKLGRHVVG
jgi:glycosyltransferase involved in cell wall biosynthesis